MTHKYYIKQIENLLKGLGAFLFLLLYIGNMAVASIAVNNTQSLEVLDKALAKQCRFSGTFSQEKSLNGLPIPLKSDGKFLFDCDYGLIWHTTSPIIETKIYTTSSNHFGLNETREIEILDSVIQTTIAKLLLDIMSANTEAISKSFTVTNSDSKSETNSVSLVPNGTFLKKGIQSITLKKDPKENALTIALVDKKTQSTRIHSIETHQNESKQASLTNCKELFKDNTTCNIFENPSSYEINSD